MSLTTQVGIEFFARNKANRTMAAFGHSVGQIRYRLRGLATSLLAVAGVGGFGYMIRQQMKSIDMIAKMSDELKLSTEAITGWEHAAKISGTSIEALHKGIEIFVRRLGEASYGTGEAQRGLEMLGLTAKELINMGTEKAFLEIAQRISQAGTAAEQAGIAYQFFGRQGVQLLNMFQQGRGGIEAMRKEAELLGLTFTRFDAAKVEAANDALTRAQAVMTGLFRQATIQLAPYIETLADRFVDFATAGEGVGANVTNAFEQMTLAAVRFGSVFQGISTRWASFKIDTMLSWADLLEFMAKIDKFMPGPGRVNAAAKLALSGILREKAGVLMREGAKKSPYGQENAVRRFYEGLRSEAAQRQAEMESRAAGAAGAEGAPLTGAPVATMDIAAAQQSMFRDMKRMTTEHYQFRTEMIEDLKEKYQAAGIERLQVEQWYTEQVQQLDITRLRSSDNFIAGIQAASIEMRLNMATWGEIGYQTAQTFQQSFGDAFSNVIQGTQSVADAFRSMAKNIIGSILQIIGRNIAVGLLAPFGIVPMQHGGIVTKPTTILAGENGPEAVIPLNKVGRSGGDVIIIFENRGTPQQLVSSSARYDEDRRIISVVIDDAQRGGMVRHMVEEIVSQEV